MSHSRTCQMDVHAKHCALDNRTVAGYCMHALTTITHTIAST